MPRAHPEIITEDTLLVNIFRLTPPQSSSLQKIGIETVRDLLFYFPVRYSSIDEVHTIHEASDGEHTAIYGRVIKAAAKKGWRSKIPMTEATLEDGTGTLRALWFHQPYVAKDLTPGSMVKLSGKITIKEGKRGMMNPEYELVTSVPFAEGTPLFTSNNPASLYPIYPETKGITSRFLYHHVQKLFTRGILDTLQDPIPEDILKRYRLPSLRSALIYIHAPKKNKDAESARKRFAFQEVFLIQLARLHERARLKNEEAFAIHPSPKTLQEFITRFPFTPTRGQTSALNDILGDFSQTTPMARLLEGDVGSGKTFVAAAATYAVVTSAPHDNKYGNLQVAYMAPTEILAEQHFQSFIEYFRGLPIEIGLITGSGAKKFPSKVDPSGATKVSRAQLLTWAQEGKLPILIGTHALIQKGITWKNLALAIVDEQHRFGTTQRGKLARREGPLPHFLSMTATPIPRTLALTLYGNLDLTVLDEVPPGRLPVKTELISRRKRVAMEQNIRAELASGRQVFVVCPRIDEPDPTKELALNAKSAIQEARRLAKDVFPEYAIDVLHGKMKPVEKESVMNRFSQGETQILVATSVVEVGVNVPNASVIVIEGAERFGLATLHQLRGRVMRSTHQPYCYLMTETKSEDSLKRLKALTRARSGFELAELDLTLRGAGELGGGKQWGISDMGMEAIKNIKLVEAARTEAHKLLAEDPALTTYPHLRALAERKNGGTHWE